MEASFALIYLSNKGFSLFLAAPRRQHDFLFAVSDETLRCYSGFRTVFLIKAIIAIKMRSAMLATNRYVAYWTVSTLADISAICNDNPARYMDPARRMIESPMMA